MQTTTSSPPPPKFTMRCSLASLLAMMIRQRPPPGPTSPSKPPGPKWDRRSRSWPTALQACANPPVDHRSHRQGPPIWKGDWVVPRRPWPEKQIQRPGLERSNDRQEIAKPGFCLVSSVGSLSLRSPFINKRKKKAGRRVCRAVSCGIPPTHTHT